MGLTLLGEVIPALARALSWIFISWHSNSAGGGIAVFDLPLEEEEEDVEDDDDER
jgi:hypothetical protein